MARTVSGAGFPSDPTNQPGQYPPPGDSFFGIHLPSSTGAPGTAGQYQSGEDSADVAIAVTDPTAGGADRLVLGDIGGADDWTTANTQYQTQEMISGVSGIGQTGAGQGHVRGPSHPNAMHAGGEPR
jgi:hypothetical protein